jgi:hypothetical protein
MKKGNEFYLKYKKEIEKSGFLRQPIYKNFERIVFFTWRNNFLDIDLLIHKGHNMEEGEVIKYSYKDNEYGEKL